MTEPREEPSSRARGAVAALTALGFLLRLLAARGMDFWADDLGTVWAAHDLTLGTALRAHPSEAHPPLSFLVTKLWFALAGITGAPGEELLARLPFLVLGSLAVPLAWLVARRLLDRERWAVAAAGLTALSPLLLWCDRDVRAYALFTPFALATVHAWLRALDDGPPRAWARFVGLAALALWTHYNAIPLVGALLLAALLERGRAGWRRPVLAGVAILVLYSPWLPAFWTHFTRPDLEAHRAHVQLAIPPVALTAPAYVLFGLVLGHSVFPWDAAIVVPVGLACILLGSSAIVRARETGCFRAPLLGLALPVAGAAATTFKMPRYYAPYAPLLAILLLSGLERLEAKARRVALALGAVLLLGTLASDANLLRGRELHFLYPRHPWRDLRRLAASDPTPVCARRETPFAQVYSPLPVLDPEVLAAADGPRRAFLLVDEAMTREEEDALLERARARGYRVVVDEAALVDEDHAERERFVPRGKRPAPVRWLLLARD